MPFHIRLKELRLQNSLTQEQLAIKLDVGTRTYLYYETGKRLPPVELIIEMAKLFNVSADFLLDVPSICSDRNRHEKLGVEQLIEEIRVLFVENELTELDKEIVKKALQDM